MARNADMGHAILIVSASEQFVALVRRSLKGFLTIDIRKSAAVARRMIMERSYDLIVINAPLPDETGEEFALDAARESGASVLLVVPAEVYDLVMEHVTDQAVLVIAKPFPRGRLDKAIRFLVAVQNMVGEYKRQVRAAHEKVEEIRVIDRAKFLLMETEHLSEDEAHRLIGKQAMDAGISRRRAAEIILEE